MLEFHLEFADDVGHEGERSLVAFFRSLLARYCFYLHIDGASMDTFILA